MKGWTVFVVIFLLLFALITIYGSTTSYTGIVNSIGSFVNGLGDTGRSIVEGFGQVIKGERTIWNFLFDWVLDLINSML